MFKIPLSSEDTRLAEGSASAPRLSGGLAGTAPSFNMITGILTDPNFRVQLQALETRADDGSGFGDKTYRVFATTEFQMVK